MSAIADVQSSKDLRNLPSHRDGEQATVARMTMTVFLNAEQKGTHMSRFVELMEAQSEAFDAGSMRVLLEKMLARLGADAGSISAAFPFFRTKAAPVSGIRSLLDYDIVLSGDLDGGRYRSRLKILIPVTSLCPCSKEISEYGAHNQRSHVTVTLDCAENVPPEDIIDIIENQASCQLYGLLKRPDEKFVTERAYENPKFVEDIVRDAAAALAADTRISEFMVESENFESIHNHSAYAYIASAGFQAA